MEKERVSNYDPNKKNYVRQHDPEHVAHNNRKQLARRTASTAMTTTWCAAAAVPGPRNPAAQQLMAPIKIEKAYMTAETITVQAT